MSPANEDHAIKKTNAAKKMSAGLTPSLKGGSAAAPDMKGPGGGQSTGDKKAGRAISKSLGVPSTKAKRPGK